MNIRTRARGEEGAAAVEFALIVGVLAMLIFGMLQFGLAFFQLQSLRAASREGARIGGMGGTVAQIQTSLQNASGISAPLGSAIYVETRTGTTASAPLADPATKPCNPTSSTPPDSVIAGVNLKSAALPAGVRQVFSVNIPLLPTISLNSATVQGEFRCES
jgi:Flp pilus assembly protein TadG